MTLGQKIKKLRTEKNLTQKDLADQVHVTFQTVSKWEKDENEPDVSTLRELAKLFDCSLDYLLSEEDKEEEKEGETPEQPPVAPVAPVTEKILSCISLAALFVNVIAKILYGDTPFSIRLAIRYVKTLVLPEPAPASTSTGPSKQYTGFNCCSFKSFSYSMGILYHRYKDFKYITTNIYIRKQFVSLIARHRETRRTIIFMDMFCLVFLL